MVKGLHIELTNICFLKCAGCSRTQFKNIFPQHWTNHSLDVNYLDRFLDIDLTDTYIRLSGHTGDPIYHPQFHEVLAQLKNRGAVIKIITNGSYKNQEWWEKTVSLLGEQDTIQFSVDGIPSNFTTYRVNADWDSIEVGMRVVAKAQCKSEWKYIPFNYNENNIEEARLLCAEIGLDHFEISISDRWDEHTEHLKPGKSHVDPRHNVQQSWKDTHKEQFELVPECSNRSTHFITANGYYVPCWNTSDFRFYYQTPFGEHLETYNIRTTTFTKVLQEEKTIDFMNNLEKYKVCQFTCGTGCGS